jgi:hypothetical protein
MVNTGIRVALALVLSVVWLAGSHAADAPGVKLDEEVLKQDRIYRGQGEEVTPGYTVDRALMIYADGLPSGFDRALADLGPADRWLDIGAGEGKAVLDYYTRAYDLAHPEGRDRRGRKAQAVAISIEDRRTRLWEVTAATLEPDQIRYLSGRRMRDYSLEELGKFQVITDVIGGFSYTDNLSRFMQRVLELLEVNGSLFTVLQDVQWEDGTNRPYYPGAPFLTRIVHPDGSDMKVCAWLKRISCVEVTCEAKPTWRPPMEAFQVRKTCNEVSVPALDTVHYQAGTPPERRFELRQ